MKNVSRIFAVMLASMTIISSTLTSQAAPAFVPLAASTAPGTVNAAFGSVEDINNACSTHATCETDPDAAYIDVNSTVNPYDVIYNYGEAYESYRRVCNWSLVFDAEYYAQQFPFLAMQYHYDPNLLLLHFSTVGVHEGRQGSADFNLGAYYLNCDESLRAAFGLNFAAYYIYYMQHYDTQQYVNTVTANNGTPLAKQYICVMTWYQANELAGVNQYRIDAGIAPVTFNSELSAYANYRGYLNAHDGWKGHDWIRANGSTTCSGLYIQLVRTFAPTCTKISENTTTCRNIPVAENNRYINADGYYNSEEHRVIMMRDVANYTGISNQVYNADTATHSQFDVFAVVR